MADAVVETPAPEVVPAVAAPVEAEKPKVQESLYIVRLPRPDIDETEQKIIAAELEIHKTKLRLLNDHLHMKRSEKEAAFQSTQEARTQLRLVQDERRALMKELQPLHSDRKGYNREISAVKDERRELTVRTEEELDRALAELEHRRAHETVSLNEEKQMLKDMKKLESQRERVREYDAKKSAVGVSVMEKERLQASISELESQLDTVRLEEDTQNHIFSKYLSEEKEIDEEMRQIKEERTEVTEIKNRLYDRLRALERQSKGKLKEFYDVRRRIIKAKEMLAAGKRDAAEQLCLGHNERVFTKLTGDRGFYTEYTRLVEKNRKVPMVPNMEEDEEEVAAAAAGGKGGKAKKPAMSKEDLEAQAKAKAASLIERMMAEAEQEVAAKKRFVPKQPEPEPEPEPVPEPVKPAAAQKPAHRPKAPVIAPVEMPVIDMDDTFVAPEDKGADKPQLSADELKEELRRHNLQAAKEASERKARREAAAAKKKKTAAQRAKEASQRAAQQKASPAAVEEAMAMEEEMEATEAAAPAERAADKGKAAMPPPPKFRPPRKAPKGVMGQAKKFHRDYPMALWATVAALVLATLLHFILR